MKEAALYSDRLSINIELPSEDSLKALAPEKKRTDILKPMAYLKENIHGFAQERKLIGNAPVFAPAGQSTQMVIGASPENDLQVMSIADALYKKFLLKRVYYSGYVPISTDSRLPQLGTPVPIIRENRLYQADWLLRFYKFSLQEIVNPKHPQLDLDIDPKLGWALRNLDQFPVDINKADYEMILRIPGVGVSSALKIVHARRFKKLGWENLKKFGIAYSRAKYFIVCRDVHALPQELHEEKLRQSILGQSKYAKALTPQFSLFG